MQRSHGWVLHHSIFWLPLFVADGPSVYKQHYFDDHQFPSNMRAIWEKRFGFVRARTGAPVVIGEMGGFYTGKDRVWQDWAIEYMAREHIGVFYFALQPGSEDTGGLLKADYTAEETAKVEQAHEGAKSVKMCWLGPKDKLVSFGFTRQSQRQLRVWDPRDLSKALNTIQIDQAAGVIMPFYDPDTSML